MFCAQIYFSHNSVPVQYTIVLYLLLLYTMQYVLLLPQRASIKRASKAAD
jgi:hypothetical protein